METYRISSKLREKNKEYLIQTANDSHLASVATSVFVDGVLAEAVCCPHPNEISPQEVLSLVKRTHEEKKQEIETLLKSYRKVIEQGDPEAMYHLGTAFYFKGFLQEARELLEATTKTAPDRHQAFNMLALVEIGLGNVARAIELGSEAVKLRPRYADYRNNLGEAYLANGACKRAVIEFEEAIGINLYYGDAYFNLGLAYLLNANAYPNTGRSEDQVAKIIDFFRKASLIQPAVTGQVFDDAMEALQHGDLGRALHLFKQIRDARKEQHRREFSGFYMKSMLFPVGASERIVADRIEFLTAEIRKNPGYVDLQAELAQCYLEQARTLWQKGVEQYRRTYEINPSLTKVHEALRQAESTYTQISSAYTKITEKG
jgi:tetratricopeptide (TPR) repeat protein